MIVKNNALLAFTAASDQTGKEGYLVDASGVVMASASAIPFGVIADGGLSGENTTVACLAGFAGIVSLKVGATTGTITAGTLLQQNADGTVRANIGTGRIVGISTQAAVATELVEATLVPHLSANAFVLVDADGATMTAAQSGGYISNLGASAAATFALPAALPGMTFTAIVEAAFALRLDPDGTETIALPSSGVQGAAGKYLEADAVGEKVKLVCLTAGTWSVEHYSGTWTAQA
jgi:hypothetical protein